MKYVLVFLLLISIGCVGQTTETPVCPEGYKYMYSMATSGLYINANECVPDSIYRKLWSAFFKSMCEETSRGMWTPTLSESHNNTWDSIKEICTTTDIYRRYLKHKWITITKEEFDKLYKEEVLAYKRKRNKKGA